MPTAPEAAKSGDVALAGKDGERIAALIDQSQARGIDVIYSLSRKALARHLAHGHYVALATGSMFDADELRTLVSWLGNVIATGDLLGRYRVRERMSKAQAAFGLHRFAEGDIPFAAIPDSIPILTPMNAVNYFKGLVPMLGRDVPRWIQTMERAAFTMATATEQTILTKVQGIIADRLQTGRAFGTAPADIEDVLTEAGLTPANSQYASMVFRTNAMDAYNVGIVHEMTHPDVKDFFPVYRYLGILDGREGDDHRPHFGKYYPSSVPFHTVRGERIFNCRCTPAPIDRYQWADLQSQGVKVETSW
jgi:hypothetical protein